MTKKTVIFNSQKSSIIIVTDYNYRNNQTINASA